MVSSPVCTPRLLGGPAYNCKFLCSAGLGLRDLLATPNLTRTPRPPAKKNPAEHPSSEPLRSTSCLEQSPCAGKISKPENTPPLTAALFCSQLPACSQECLQHRRACCRGCSRWLHAIDTLTPHSRELGFLYGASYLPQADADPESHGFFYACRLPSAQGS
jgi:hypothetical protein